MCFTRFSRRHSLRSSPVSRVTRRTLHGPGAAVGGVPIMCPVTYCNTLVPPSFTADGEIEYRCYVGRHGRVGRVVDGRIELTVRTYVSPRHVVVASRPRCAYPGCNLPRNSTCGRQCCLRHCLKKSGSCGGYKHDYDRALAELEARRRGESLEVHPSTPLFLPSSSPEPEPEPELEPTPPSSPMPGVDYDPDVAYVQLVFTDRDLTVEAVCDVEGDLVDLNAQSLRTREKLHVHQIRKGTLEFRGADDVWHATAGRATPVRYGRLLLRARSVVRNFPRDHYVDMAPRVHRFYRLVDRNVSPDTAFQVVFDCEPSESDHESLELCREALQKSPRRLRERFDAAGRTPQGTWAEFVHTCFDSDDEHASSPPSNGARSPTFARSRPSWRGPDASEAGSSRSYNQNASPPPMIIVSDSE